MSLLFDRPENWGLFAPEGEFLPEAFREFLKADDMKGNPFIGIVYDMSDYGEYR